MLTNKFFDYEKIMTWHQKNASLKVEMKRKKFEEKLNNFRQNAFFSHWKWSINNPSNKYVVYYYLIIPHNLFILLWLKNKVGTVNTLENIMKKKLTT